MSGPSNSIRKPSGLTATRCASTTPFYILMHTPCAACVKESEVGLYCKGKLVDKNLLESGNIVLLVEDKHSLLVVHRVNRTEGYRAVLVRNQNCIAGDAGSALVAVGEWLDVG